MSGDASSSESARDPWAAPGSVPEGSEGPQYAGPADAPAEQGPQERPAPAPSAPSVHDQQTVTSLPGVPGPAAPPTPAAHPGATPPPAVPPAEQAWAAPPADGAVPPPPLAPDGPVQVPYGCPVPYAHPAAPYGAPGPAAQPGYGGAPGHPVGPGAYGWPPVPQSPSNGMGIASLTLGIVAAVGFCLWPVAIVGGVLALVFGLIGRAKARRGEATNPGQALAGIICGSAGLALAVAFVVLLFAP
ncbi:DUF4190 domain-containing protein [Streptomyces sp. NPDC058417]|uniref:DUF4190 domain-containing protein n=1 Tax=unclassified Streptomyces TaxID=2593676 RepID=UPI0036528CB1